MFLFFFFLICLIFKWIVGLGKIKVLLSLGCKFCSLLTTEKKVFHKSEDEKSKLKSESALTSAAAPFLLCDASC